MQAAHGPERPWSSVVRHGEARLTNWGVVGKVGNYLRTVARYARVFSWRQLALFKISDLLVEWTEHPTLRRARALRLFSYEVPPDDLTLDDGEFRFSYEVAGRDVTLALRRESSDLQVFLQVLRNSEYGDAMRLLAEAPESPKILDVGANIGLTTLFFKCHRPDARVVALEPEPASFDRLERCVDCNGLEGVRLLNEGLWTHDTRLAPETGFRDGQSWSFALREVPPGKGGAVIPVRSLESLLASIGWVDVDLLKIDVEGAEAGLLRDPGFLATARDHVRLLCMEIHPEAIGTMEAQEALASVGFRSVLGGETLVAWRAE